MRITLNKTPESVQVFREHRQVFLTKCAVELKKYKTVKKVLAKKKSEGAPGFEPGTSRSAVECSATELYPQHYVCGSLNVPFKVR